MKSSRLKILHIAPINTSGVPGQMVLTERKLGFESRLLTLFHDDRNYYRDICLELPFIDFRVTKWIKKYVSSPDKLVVSNTAKKPARIPIEWHPYSTAEKILVKVRDVFWIPRVQCAIRKYKLDRFDVFQLDGGLGLYRNSRFIRQMKAQGKKIICCYTGSDLRTRGVIPAIDRLSDLNVTVEYDHLLLHPKISHIFFPFNAENFSAHQPSGGKIRIGHAPTNRAAKGSDTILSILDLLKKEIDFQIVLIQNLSYSQAIKLKQTCDIFIDQIGDLGYGINSLEALAMGIPCCSCLAKGFERQYTDHPFVVIDKDNMYEKVKQLLQSPQRRKEIGARGRLWVRKFHNAENVVQKIHRLAGLEEL
ncbi:glycosyltransferase family 1 protein [candidate division KSB1 bacterium]|nr:glycosyltransferase family 1 protein [candidate division KSB1 bacterium]